MTRNQDTLSFCPSALLPFCGRSLSCFFLHTCFTPLSCTWWAKRPSLSTSNQVARFPEPSSKSLGDRI